MLEKKLKAIFTGQQQQIDRLEKEVKELRKFQARFGPLSPYIDDLTTYLKEWTESQKKDPLE